MDVENGLELALIENAESQIPVRERASVVVDDLPETSETDEVEPASRFSPYPVEDEGRPPPDIDPGDKTVVGPKTPPGWLTRLIAF